MLGVRRGIARPLLSPRADLSPRSPAAVSTEPLGHAIVITMASHQQILFAETIAAMKKAVKRKAYGKCRRASPVISAWRLSNWVCLLAESDSDSEIEHNTNRGQKLKKRARFVRGGQLAPPNGPAVYKEVRSTHSFSWGALQCDVNRDTDFRATRLSTMPDFSARLLAETRRSSTRMATRSTVKTMTSASGTLLPQRQS